MLGAVSLRIKKSRMLSWYWRWLGYCDKDFLFNKREQLKFFCVRKRCDQCSSITLQEHWFTWFTFFKLLKVGKLIVKLFKWELLRPLIILSVNIYWVLPVPNTLPYFSEASRQQGLLVNLLFGKLAQLIKNLPAVQETPVWLLSQEDPLEEG